MSHRWSGWPGACCLDCGAEDAMENAMGLNWVDFIGDEKAPDLKWRSEDHERLVELCNNNCAAKMTAEAYEKILVEAQALSKKIEEQEHDI